MSALDCGATQNAECSVEIYTYIMDGHTSFLLVTLSTRCRRRWSTFSSFEVILGATKRKVLGKAVVLHSWSCAFASRRC